MKIGTSNDSYRLMLVTAIDMLNYESFENEGQAGEMFLYKINEWLLPVQCDYFSKNIIQN
jgi:hypothetical protein